MHSVEWYFNDTIEQLSMLTLTATNLVKEIPTLTPSDVRLRCQQLSTMQEKLSEDKEQFFAIMDFVGRGVLDTFYIGEFQRALDKSVLACDSLHAVILQYKSKINS
ncbi:MAG: hypothetical protein OEL83_13090 [Desulforhopalus sp.]|nr:hypothetical protein [Desulforhopalus sp.]